MTSESGRSESEPLSEPGLFHAVPFDELSQVEFESQFVNILEAETSTSPSPLIAFITKVAFKISISVGRGNFERLNSINDVVEDVFVFAAVLLPIYKPLPLF